MLKYIYWFSQVYYLWYLSKWILDLINSDAKSIRYARIIIEYVSLQWIDIRREMRSLVVCITDWTEVKTELYLAGVQDREEWWGLINVSRRANISTTKADLFVGLPSGISIQ
jgi:hypothetical protein